MAKVWKKLQRADSPFAGDVTGNVTGKVNNVAVSGVYTTSNKPTKGDVGLGSVTNHAAYHAANKPTKIPQPIAFIATPIPLKPFETTLLEVPTPFIAVEVLFNPSTALVDCTSNSIIFFSLAITF